MERPPVDLGEEAYRRPRGVDRLARFVLDVFYRSVQVEGIEKVPAEGAVVFVGNHFNGLLDPAILLAYLPRPSRFLGKSTLWNNPALRPFIRLAAAIPVYRRQDPGVDPAKNAETFDRCHRVLAAGGTIALFPEGRSHNEPALVPLKTGVARIVLEAMDRFPGTRPTIVPVGLTFDDKTRFRSRLLVKIGDPIVPERAPADDEANRRAVRELTDRVRKGLEAVTLSYPSWEEARLIERAAAIYSRPTLEAPAEQPLADSFAVRRLFVDGYERLLEACPERVHRVAEEVRDYDARLRLLRLRDEQVASAYRPRTVRRFVARSLFVLGVRLPLGLLGTVLNLLPYRLTDWVSRRFADSADVESTYKVFPALLLYPLNWLLWAVGAAIAYGAWDGGATPAPLIFGVVLLVGPVSAFFAFSLHQRWDVFSDQVRAFFLLRSDRRAVADLKEQRRRLVDQVTTLVSEAERLSAAPAPS